MNMKKSILTAAMLLVSFCTLQAQRDTLGYNVATPWYFKNYPIEDMHDTIHHNTNCTPNTYSLARVGENSFYSSIGCNAFYTGDVAYGFYPDSTIHIIGVAWVKQGLPYDGYPDEPTETMAILQHQHSHYDSIFCRLYLPNGNYMSLVREKGLECLDKNECRMVDFAKGLPGTGFRYLHMGTMALIYEIFFDNEIDVTDSFYISCKYGVVGYGGGLYEDRTAAYFEIHNPVVDTFIYPPLSYRILPDSASSADDPWIYGVKRTYPLLFPIIRRDCDTCPVVRGIEVIGSGAGQSFLRWQRGTEHLDWQVSYGPVGTAPDDGTIADYTSPISGYIYYNPDTQYVAYVRARCRFARYEWGPWSTPVTLNTPNGIDDVQLAGMITLSPNPATQTVTIDSPLPTTLVEAYDEKGALMTSVNTSTLDVSQWPTGVYTLRIHTPQGIAVKKLVVK